MKKKIKPADFMDHPYASVQQSAEAEVVARNIIAILDRTGNKFRKLSWTEYKKERLKDGNFTEDEKSYFDDVIGFCKSAETAKLFSKVWADKKSVPASNKEYTDLRFSE